MKRIILLIALISCTLAGFAQSNAADMEQVRKLVMAHSAIANLYVEPVDEPKLVEASIKAMLKELDPHSTYLNAKEVEKMNEPLQGNFEGIGVQFNMADDTLFVIQTVSNGPSEKVGILPGDRIVTVNDTAIAGVKMERDEIMKRLRGPKGSVVQLGIVRRGYEEQLVFRVTRDKIPVHTLDAAYMIAPKVGYIKISSFGATTHEEFSQALTQLKKEKMQHLLYSYRTGLALTTTVHLKYQSQWRFGMRPMPMSRDPLQRKFWQAQCGSRHRMEPSQWLFVPLLQPSRFAPNPIDRRVVILIGVNCIPSVPLPSPK